MNGLLNQLKMYTAQNTQSETNTRIGLVTGYDPSSHMATVAYQPTGESSGWLPIGAKAVGAGWGFYSPPNLGDMVIVHFAEKDANSGYIGDRFYNDFDLPLNVPAGEFWAVHKTGSFLKFHNDGSVEVNTAGNLTATVAGNLTTTAQGFISNTSQSIIDLNAPTVNVQNALAVGNGASGTIIDVNGKVATFQAGICTDIS